MKVFGNVKEWRDFRKILVSDAKPKSIGFIPTMGCLHEGHCSLIRRSISENDFSVLSIFINETQFTESSDYANYPRTIKEDLDIAKREGVDAVILPTKDEMYPDGFRYKVTENDKSLIREGLHRPGHFTGMLTVVMKLINIVEADRAYFGEKDYQQYELVKGMMEAFFINTEIVLCPIVRDEHGMALSSRNRRLSKEEVVLARHFPALLSSKRLSSGEIVLELEKVGFKVYYVEEVEGRRYGSVRIGETVLIDNVLVLKS